MNAREVMTPCPVTLSPGQSVSEAIAIAGTASMDILPIVDKSGMYCGSVPISTLIDNAQTSDIRIDGLCCTNALVCDPHFSLEHLSHDEQNPVSHKTVMIVDEDGHFHGVVPHVHWAVDEAKVQSGYPRNPLESRTISMHLTWRCLDCGDLTTRNSGIPSECPHCCGDAFALHTED